MPWKMKGLQLNEARMPPHIQQGQPMQILNFNKVEEFTKPPDYLQESELISLMDKHGIGKNRNYVFLALFVFIICLFLTRIVFRRI